MNEQDYKLKVYLINDKLKGKIKTEDFFDLQEEFKKEKSDELLNNLNKFSPKNPINFLLVTLFFDALGIAFFFLEKPIIGLIKFFIWLFMVVIYITIGINILYLFLWGIIAIWGLYDLFTIIGTVKKYNFRKIKEIIYFKNNSI